MNHLMRFSIIAVLLFSIVSCDNNQSINQLQDSSTSKVKSAAYVFNTEAENPDASLQAIKKETLKASQNHRSKSYKQTNAPTNHKAVGIVNTSTPNTLVFSATENNVGVYGKNNLDGAYFNNVKFNSECLTVVGNQAFFGGAITSWEAGPGFPSNTPPVSEGWQLYMAAEDNGEGKNAEDAFGGGLVFFPPGTTLGDIEQQYGFSAGFFEAQGINSRCDFAAFLYSQGQVPYVFVIGENPTNVQVK